MQLLSSKKCEHPGVRAQTATHLGRDMKLFFSRNKIRKKFLRNLGWIINPSQRGTKKCQIENWKLAVNSQVSSTYCVLK